MARLMTRRAALTALGTLVAGSVLGLGYVCRSIFDSRAPGLRFANGPDSGGMMGVGPVDMGTYMEMFSRHTEINRVVEELPGGVRTITESNSTDLVAQLQAHVSSMYSRLGQGTEVMCMSQSLPTLFRNPSGYRRQLPLPRPASAPKRPPTSPPSLEPSAIMPGRSLDSLTTECPQ